MSSSIFLIVGCHCGRWGFPTPYTFLFKLWEFFAVPGEEGPGGVGGGGRAGGKARRGNVDSSRGAELSTMTGHSKLVLSVAFSADGQWVMSGSSDKTIRLWDTHAAAQ